MELYYKTYGEGYPLIILHGLFGSLENWQTLSRVFAKCYRVFAIDQRNHGHSPHDPTMDYAVMAKDLREFMQAQRLSSAYLLGHSMGGKTAMQFALTYPEQVDKLIVVDIAPKAYPPQHDDILDAMRSIEPGAFSTRKEVDAALARKLPDVALRQFLLKNLERDDAGALQWSIDLDAIERNYPQLVQSVHGTHARFEKPTLFIRGQRSEYIQDADMPAIRKLFPYSRLATLPGVGHWVHVEAQRRFARLVLTFLGQM
jgi:esterase